MLLFYGRVGTGYDPAGGASVVFITPIPNVSLAVLIGGESTYTLVPGVAQYVPVEHRASLAVSAAAAGGSLIPIQE